MIDVEKLAEQVRVTIGCLCHPDVYDAGVAALDALVAEIERLQAILDERIDVRADHFGYCVPASSSKPYAIWRRR